jgi:RimJ/RimL family protein N-acetyltransferase
MQIRQITLDDAAAFLTLRLALDQETDLLMYEAGERQTTVDEERANIRQILDGGGTILVVEADGRLIGFLEAIRGAFRRNRHTVYIVVARLQAYAGQGIGQQLFEHLDEWARAHEIHRLELTVQVRNKNAIVLYQKLGFRIEGTRIHSLWINGQWVDEYYMGKLLDSSG